MVTRRRDMVPLDAQVREGLATVVDSLLPGTAALPPGRAVGAHLDLLERVLDADPSLETPVVAAGRWAAEAPSCGPADLVERWGAEAERVVFALTSAYYLDPGVRAALGYPGQERRPVAEATPQEQVTETLIAPVLERGPVYVPVPE